MLKRNTRFGERQTGQLAQARNNTVGPRPIKVVTYGSNNTPVKFEYLMEYRCTKIVLTDHVRTRAGQRHGMPIEQMKVYFQHVIDGLDGFTWTHYNQEVFVYSKAYQRGMIIARRRDHKNQASNKMVLVAVTCYPYGKSIPAHPDTEIIYV
jgi:hypothetical protein